MVTLAALVVGKEALPDYAHRFSPKVYTQPQLFACLVLMVFLRTDYRGIEPHLLDLPAYRDWLGLKRVPDHSTLQKAAQRFFTAALSAQVLAVTINLMMGRGRMVRQAAADSTGMESGQASPYFVRRRQRGQKPAKNPLFQTTTYTRFPKLTLLVDCQRHLILALLTGKGPKPDVQEIQPLLGRLPARVTLLKLLADAGFDSEANHRFLREEHGIQSLIPPKRGRPPQGGQPPGGRYRRRMQSRLRSKRQRRRSGYTQRTQVETVISMIKRNLGHAVAAQTYAAQNRELRRLAIVHNILVLLLIVEVFDGANLYRLLKLLERPEGHFPPVASCLNPFIKNESVTKRV